MTPGTLLSIGVALIIIGVILWQAAFNYVRGSAKPTINAVLGIKWLGLLMIVSGAGFLLWGLDSFGPSTIENAAAPALVGSGMMLMMGLYLFVWRKLRGFMWTNYLAWMFVLLGGITLGYFIVQVN